MTRHSLELRVILRACEQAELALERTADDRQALDAALEQLHDGVGPDLLCCVFLRKHDRIWILAQRGYDQVRDGYALTQGVMARAIRTGKVQYVPAVEEDPDYVAATGGIVAEVAIPFGEEDPAYGVLNVETRQRSIPPGAVTPLALLAEKLGKRVAAIETEPRLDLSTLARLFVHASSLREPQAIAELVARSLGRLLDLESAQLNVTGESGERELATFWRRPESTATPLSAPCLHRIAATVDATAAYALLDSNAIRRARAGAKTRRGVIWLPLRARGAEVGVLVGSARRSLAFDLAAGEAAKLLAAHAATSLDAARALARERRAALTDPLTGLMNRRGFDDRFAEKVETAKRGAEGVSLVVFDCDNFKSINDEGGHDVGDRALEAIAGYLRASVRSEDTVGRLGGEEFAVLLPDTEPSRALAAAERLRRGLAQEVIDDWGRPITASFGVATYPDDGETPADLLRAADQAMYLAKRSGKNQSLSFAQIRRLTADGRGTGARESMLALTQFLDEGYLHSNAHSRLVGTCARLIAQGLRLSPGERERLWVAGVLHDIGKIGLPEDILRKSGPLTDDEWDEVRRHPVIGANMLERLRDDEVQRWIRHHHERLDGRGYPDGLPAEEIPLGARILAVADAFEAMTSARPYRAPLSIDEATAELRRCAGSQFDPLVVEVLVAALATEESVVIRALAA
ncbi:MAG: diguanylate cyclase [Actinomycetota bacterium]|nr:diguanylate cyclase [Actinomycetota bacterium]